ncbi:MAG: dephospho-CoA kinase [Egibacteraceae bacterium]
MYLAGLTGGIASGKSTVARRFAEVHGAQVIDADAIAREIVLPGRPAHERIVEHFGPEVLDADGRLDRPALGRVVFTDPDARALLDRLTHPVVAAEIADRLERLADFDGLVIVDVPLLVEAGVGREYCAIVVVATHVETQRRRLVEERGMAPDEADSRIAAQAPLADKLAVATHVIWNEGTLAELATEIDRVAEELIAAAT